MKQAIAVNIQNQGALSILLVTCTGFNSTLIATKAAMFAKIISEVKVPRLHSSMKHIPAKPKQVSNPNAGVNSRCLLMSPSLSRRLAIAKPGRNATSKPRDIEAGSIFMPSNLFANNHQLEPFRYSHGRSHHTS